jgi:hypothetical protein
VSPPGRHAADDGSFGRSAGNAMVRGALLLAIAVILGVVLLNTFDKGTDPFAQDLVAAGKPTTTTSEAKTPEATTTTTTSAATTLRAAADVKVLPLNGTGVNRFGAKVGDKLKTFGFNVLAADDATNKPVATSAVYFAAGYEAEARDIASKLGLAPDAVKSGTPPAKTQALNLGGNVTVVAGADLTSRIK